MASVHQTSTSSASYPAAAEPGPGSLLAVLRRRLLIIVLTTLLVGAAAAAYAYLGPRSYQTTAELLFNQTIGTQLNALGLAPPNPNADNLASDNQATVASRRVAILTARLLHDGTSVDTIQKDVSVPAPKTSDVVQIVVTAKSAPRVALIANTYAQAAIATIKGDRAQQSQALVRSLNAQIRTLPPKSPVRPGLQARAATVAAVGAAGSDAPSLIEAGHVPSSESGSPLATTLLGVLFGLLLGVGLALLREQSDGRLRRAEEVSAALATPVLATVPRDRALVNGSAPGQISPSLLEPFLMLQADLRYGDVEPLRSVLVTSSREKQGKSTVAWNLGVAAALSGTSVVIVDADLRRSAMASRHRLQPFPGLAEVVRGDVRARSAIQSVPLAGEPSDLNGHGPRLEVLVAGAAPPDPVALLQSPRMAELLELLGRSYDLVIVDTPPIAQVSDAVGLLRIVDGVLVVVSINQTQGPEAQRLGDQLRRLDARLLGAVVNGGSRTSGYVNAPLQTRTN